MAMHFTCARVRADVLDIYTNLVLIGFRGFKGKEKKSTFYKGKMDKLDLQVLT